MQLQTYHQHIQAAITTELQNVHQQVRIAVAWFTNKQLMAELLTLLNKGSQVEVVILNDQLNFRTRGIDYQHFINRGGKLYISYQGQRLHHKCCLIDQQTVLTGSYNWTYYAEHHNLENLLIVRDAATFANYQRIFEQALSAAEPIEHLANFHAFHPPIENLLTRDYDTGDQAQQLIEELVELSPEAALMQLEEIGHTTPNLIHMVIAKQPEPVRQLITNRQEAMKALVERYYNWSLEELQQHRFDLNKDLLLQNTEILWTPEKIRSLEFSPAQLELLYRKGRFDDLPRLLFELEEEIPWNDLSQNDHISWTENLLDKYAARVSWDWAINRTAFTFEKEHIQKYQRWFGRWHSISSCRKVNWSIELIRNFEGNWSWYNLSINPSIPWTAELFETFEGRWDYHFLSQNNNFCWSNEIIDRHVNRWSWYSLAENTGVNWNQQLIEKYIQKWDRFKLFRNPGIQWTEMMIRHFSDWFDQDIHSWCNGWTYISMVDSAWKTSYIVRQFANKWHWWYVAKWQKFNWSASFIEKYADKLFVYYQSREGGINGLCENLAFPWTENLIREKAHVINHTYGNGWSHISVHPRLPMNISFLLDFAERLSFSRLSGNPSPNFHMGIVRAFPEKDWDWKALAERQDLAWSPELLEEFHNRWDWSVISTNRSVYDKLHRPILNRTIFSILMNQTTLN